VLVLLFSKLFYLWFKFRVLFLDNILKIRVSVGVILGKWRGRGGTGGEGEGL